MIYAALIFCKSINVIEIILKTVYFYCKLLFKNDWL